MAKNPRGAEDLLDKIDGSIISALIDNGRASNRQLAAAAGVAESTAHARLRALEARGVIVGYEAVIAPDALGNTIQALVGVSLRAGARQAHIENFTNHVRQLREVSQFFFVGGGDDFVIHIAVPNSASLRRFVVEEISGHESVASTRTSIVFDYARNRALPSMP